MSNRTPIDIGPNGLLYVPHRDSMTTWWLRLNGDGTLTMEGALASEAGAGPRHIAFHPNGMYAYVVNEYADSVSAHTIGADGALTRFQTEPGLAAEDTAETNSAADVHITDDGRFVYCSQRGDDSIARFAVSAADGSLSRLGNTPTEPRPREFELTPGGGYLLALGQDSGAMAIYRIEDDGDLSPLSTVALGTSLRWAIAVAEATP